MQSGSSQDTHMTDKTCFSFQKDVLLSLLFPLLAAITSAQENISRAETSSTWHARVSRFVCKSSAHCYFGSVHNNKEHT